MTNHMLVFNPTLPYSVTEPEFVPLAFLIGLLTRIKHSKLDSFVDRRNRYAKHMLQEAKL